jgi:hypothetical protein
VDRLKNGDRLLFDKWIASFAIADQGGQSMRRNVATKCYKLLIQFGTPFALVA